MLELLWQTSVLFRGYSTRGHEYPAVSDITGHPLEFGPNCAIWFGLTRNPIEVAVLKDRIKVKPSGARFCKPSYGKPVSGSLDFLDAVA